MEHLISDLLDFALIQAGRLTVEREVVEADSLVHESVEMFKPLAAEKGVRIEGVSEPGLLLHADRERLLQVISNVVGNAIKFTPAEGSVALRLTRSGPDAIFAVTDTGRGMSAEELSRMWGRYWQAKRKSEEGLGLGLFITRGLVEAHGGRIWAESSPEAGSTFFFTMPLAPAVTSEAEAAGHTH